MLRPDIPRAFCSKEGRGRSSELQRGGIFIVAKKLKLKLAFDPRIPLSRWTLFSAMEIHALPDSLLLCSRQVGNGNNPDVRQQRNRWWPCGTDAQGGKDPGLATWDCVWFYVILLPSGMHLHPALHLHALCTHPLWATQLATSVSLLSEKQGLFLLL